MEKIETSKFHIRYLPKTLNTLQYSIPTTPVIKILEQEVSNLKGIEIAISLEYTRVEFDLSIDEGNFDESPYIF